MIKFDKKSLAVLFVTALFIASAALYAEDQWTVNASAKQSDNPLPERTGDEITVLGTWSTNAPVPVPNGLSQSTLVKVGGLIYSIGGGVGAGPDSRTNQVWAYEPYGDTWTQKADIPIPGGISAYGAADALGNFIYVFGGITGAGADVSVLTSTWIYDTINDNWIQGSDMPEGRFGSAVALMGGKFFIAGGATLADIQNQTWLYDPETDSYMTRAPMTTPLFRIHGAAIINENMAEFHVFAGGFDGRSHLVYNPILNTWRNAPMMPFGVTDPGVVALGGRFYVLGGLPLGIGQVYDPRRGIWNLLGPIMPAGINNTSAAVFNNTIYVIGGFNGTTSTPANYSLTVQ